MNSRMKSTAPAELHQLADASLVDAIRVHAAWQQPSEISEREGVLLLAGCNEFPGAYKNCAARLNRSASPGAALAAAAQFFAERGRDYTWFVRAAHDADLEQALLQQPQYLKRSDSPCMIVTERVPEPALPGGLHAERYAHEQHLRDAAQVLAASYAQLGLPGEEVHALLAHPQRLLDDARTTGFVVYRGREPVATAITVHSDGASGIYWVGTSPTAQRLGLATLTTALATNAGFDAGAQVVTLQASPMGEPVYTRMGYRTYDRLRWYRARRDA